MKLFNKHIKFLPFGEVRRGLGWRGSSLPFGEVRRGAFALSLLFSACTDADLCYLPDHPHRAGVQFSFDWSDYTQQPDTMMIICSRIVKSWRSAVDVSTTDGRGHFVYNEPQFPAAEPPAEPAIPGETTPDGETTPGEDETTPGEETTSPDDDTTPGDTPTEEEPAAAKTRADGDTPTEPTTPADPTTPAEDPADTPQEKGDTELFTLPVGTYKFVAVNHDTTQVIYNDVWTYIEDNTGMPFHQVYATYKTYDLGDKDYKGHIPGWEDNNSYGAQYVQRHLLPLYYDTIAPRDIVLGDKAECRFRPRPVTQNIDVYLTITKKSYGNPFTVDSVEAEIAGVPISVNLATGNIDVTKTAKMPFPMERYDEQGNLLRSTFRDGDRDKLISSGDTKNSTSIRCHANIDATGIVRNIEPSATVGPGIMQLVIYITVDKEVTVDGVKKTQPFRKMIQGKINLYNTLTDAKLLDYLDGGRFVKKHADQGVLDILADIVIDGDAIVEQEEEGFDSWKQAGEGKDIEIEL